MKFNKKYFCVCLVFLLPSIAFSAALNPENFLVISDIHLSSVSQHAMDINPSKPKPENDLDLPTFKKLIQSVSQNVNKGVISQPKFILYLGDLVGHQRTTIEAVIKDETLVFSE